MVSDNLIKYYEDTVKKGVAPHTMHNLPLECAAMLLEQLSAIHPRGAVNVKQANNIWNYIIGELVKRGHTPYTFKINGFSIMMEQFNQNKPINNENLKQQVR